MTVDVANSTVYGREGKVVALIGVENLVVVDTEDALLVCNKQDAQRVKDVLQRLQGDDKYGKYI